MNITELKELAEKATPGPWVAGDDEDSDYFLVGPCGDDCIVYQSVVKLHSEINAAYIAAANPAEILELIANLEDAQGEIRALRATESGLRDQLAALEKAIMDAEPVAWLNQDSPRDPIGREKKIDMETVNGIPGRSLAAKHSVPLYTLNGVKKP